MDRIINFNNVTNISVERTRVSDRWEFSKKSSIRMGESCWRDTYSSDIYFETDILNRHKDISFIEDGKIYTKPKITIYFVNKSYISVLFETDEELDGWLKGLEARFGGNCIFF